ncbi:unnamed protein product [Cuscuta epithymum]|uniref:AT-rich interactive domain-containing protein 2 n=2 Tax=Cuscuta epithymum TaxID=186058 RepID=A0AAV0EMV3_9ASTE|nr:unnamed protein product [Cuscuta epithymum]
MEAWSNSKDESTLYEAEINHTSNWGFEFFSMLGVEDWVFDGCKKKLRVMFDQILISFLNDVSKNRCFRPLPVMNGCGHEVDLFKLYSVVRRIGGYNSVSKENLWGYVSEQCGLDFREMSFVKLIYSKYLNDFDQWIGERCRDSALEKVESGLVRRLELMSRELKVRFGNMSSNNSNQKTAQINQKNSVMKNGGREVLTDVEIGSVCDYYAESTERLAVNNIQKNRLFIKNINGESVTHSTASSPNMSVQKVVNSVADCPQEEFVGCMKGSAKDKGDVATTSIKHTEKLNEVNILKRKRTPSYFSEILDWVTSAAKHCDSPEILKIPDFSQWKDHSMNDSLAQVLLIREVLLNKNHFSSNSEESAPQKKLKMHPSMYDDNTPDHVSMEKMRCSQRIFSLTNPLSCPINYSSSPTDNNVVSTQKREPESAKNVSREEPTSLPKVPVGPLHQAEVPEWTGLISESDSKWQGTLMWPPEETKSFNELDRIGRGREGQCDCQFPSSVQCIRFHTAEKRYKLKLELGRLFYQWRFDRMGEEVSLSWTEEEEEKFKNLMRQNATTPNKFWNSAAKKIPLKTKSMLVSYYYNVFLVKRRSYQNRVTPKDIDSDDDEKEFGSVGCHFGYETIYVPGSRPLLCTENKVCTDLE